MLKHDMFRERKSCPENRPVRPEVRHSRIVRETSHFPAKTLLQILASGAKACYTIVNRD